MLHCLLCVVPCACCCVGPSMGERVSPCTVEALPTTTARNHNHPTQVWAVPPALCRHPAGRPAAVPCQVGGRQQRSRPSRCLVSKLASKLSCTLSPTLVYCAVCPAAKRACHSQAKRRVAPRQQRSPASASSSATGQGMCCGRRDSPAMNCSLWSRAVLWCSSACSSPAAAACRRPLAPWRRKQLWHSSSSSSSSRGRLVPQRSSSSSSSGRWAASACLSLGRAALLAQWTSTWEGGRRDTECAVCANWLRWGLASLACNHIAARHGCQPHRLPSRCPSPAAGRGRRRQA